jgi:hypothetical protein
MELGAVLANGVRLLAIFEAIRDNGALEGLRLRSFRRPPFFTTHFRPCLSPPSCLFHPVNHSTVSLSTGMAYVLGTHVRSLATHYDE